MGGAMVLRRAFVSILALELALMAAVALAPPCLACSCVLSSPAQKLRRAEAAFVGEVVAQRTADGGTMQTFQVDEVYRGELAATIDVWAAIGSAGSGSCGVLFPQGERVAVLLFRQDGRWTTEACSLVTPQELRRVGGPPRDPIPAGSRAPAPGDSAAGAFEPSDAAGGLPAWAVVAVGALLAVGAIGVTTLVMARRDRRAAYPSGWDPVDEPDAAGSDTR